VWSGLATLDVNVKVERRESDVGKGAAAGDVEGQGELQGEVAEMALTREDAEAGHILRLRINVVGVAVERVGDA